MAGIAALASRTSLYRHLKGESVTSGMAAYAGSRIPRLGLEQQYSFSKNFVFHAKPREAVACQQSFIEQVAAWRNGYVGIAACNPAVPVSPHLSDRGRGNLARGLSDWAVISLLMGLRSPDDPSHGSTLADHIGRTTPRCTLEHRM